MKRRVFLSALSAIPAGALLPLDVSPSQEGIKMEDGKHYPIKGHYFGDGNYRSRFTISSDGENAFIADHPYRPGDTVLGADGHLYTVESTISPSHD